MIPVRLSDDEVKQIDLLAKRAGGSRSRVIREILQERLGQELSNDLDVSDLVEKLLRLRAKGNEPVKLRLTKSATELVSEGRD